MPEVRGARFFHALVVVGAAVSATACGGRSEQRPSGEGAGGGTSGNGGDAAATGGTLANDGSGSGSGAAGAGGAGSAAGEGGRAGATSTAGGKAGAGGIGPFPEAELPTSQWDCASSYSGCVDALGVSAHQLTGSCPVDATRPKSAADCSADEIYSCELAVSVSGEPVLVNCWCQPGVGSPCAGCVSLNHRNGEPVSCAPSLKICECAYTGILR